MSFIKWIDENFLWFLIISLFANLTFVIAFFMKFMNGVGEIVMTGLNINRPKRTSNIFGLIITFGSGIIASVSWVLFIFSAIINLVQYLQAV